MSQIISHGQKKILNLWCSFTLLSLLLLDIGFVLSLHVSPLLFLLFFVFKVESAPAAASSVFSLSVG